MGKLGRDESAYLSGRMQVIRESISCRQSNFVDAPRLLDANMFDVFIVLGMSSLRVQNACLVTCSG